jgi:hypothetical protein
MAASPADLPSTAWHGVDRPKSPLPGASLPPARRGRLRNGNRPGDFLAAPRCGAHTRCGGECRQPAMPNGRCRLHGGLSTGPRTPAGLARSRRARWKHGAYSAEVRALCREARARLGRVRSLSARPSARPAGHGVDRFGRQTAEDRGQKASRPKVSPGPAAHGLPAGAFRRPSSVVCPPIPAGHGVHRSKSPGAPSGLSLSKINDEARRALRDLNSILARATGSRPASVTSVRSVAAPPPAGHGLHPLGGQRTVGRGQKASRPAASPGVAAHSIPAGTFRRPSSAHCPPDPAGHGLNSSFRERLRSSTAIGLC